MTRVVNLATGDEYYYMLPPWEAVRSAYLQYELKDRNTWNYNKQKKEPLVFGRFTVACGDYCSMK